MKFYLQIFISFLFLSINQSWAQSGHGVDSNQVDYSTPKEYEIGGIKVIGQHATSEAVIIARTGLTVGELISIPGESISNAIKKLWASGMFSDIQIHFEKKPFGKIVFLLIKVQERPRLSAYAIVGVNKAERDKLKEKLRLNVNDPFTSFDETLIKNTISKYYVDKGYLRVNTSIILKPDTVSSNKILLTIEIDKGRKVHIASINFIGNTNVPGRKLRAAMKETKEKSKFLLTPKKLKDLPKDSSDVSISDVLSNLSLDALKEFLDQKVVVRIFNASKFKQAEYTADKKKVIDYYNNLGYRDAAIVLDTVYYEDESNLKIDIKVKEGSRYYFRKIEWDGNTKYSSEILSSILDIRKGDIYDQKRLNDKLFFDQNGADVSSLYMDDGYLFFNVTPNEVKVENDSIDIKIRVYEGPQAIINKILIKGNTKTNEHVIRRELRTIPGSKFSRTDLIRTQREIAALGYFDPEQIGINPIPHPESGTVDIEYTVVEKPSDQIELSAGWGGAVGGIYGSAGIVFNNFSLKNIFNPRAYTPLPSGDGQKISFRLQSSGRFLQSYTFSFTEPWLGGKKPNALSTSFNHTYYNTSGLKRTDEEASYIISRGGTIGIGKRLKWPDNYFYLTSSVNFQNYKLQNYSGFLIRDGQGNNFYLKETLSRVSTDQQLYPSSGSNVSLSLQVTPPYSIFDPSRVSLPDEEKFKWVEYHKWRFNAEWYTTLAGSDQPGKRRLVLKAGAKFGYLGFYNQDMGITPFERFRLGGDGLSGGFTLYGYDIISLRGTEDAFVPVGGTSGVLDAPIFNKFTVELRYPISLSQASTIYALAFLEGGNSYANIDNYNPFNLRRSAGIGLRLFLPMFGLLGFDYGINFEEFGNKPFGDILGSGAFHFKLGFEPE